MKLLVACPTVTGREASLQRMMDAYRLTWKGNECDLKISIVYDRDTCGRGWVGAVNEGLVGFEPDFIHPTCDDLEPQPGWFEAAVGAVQLGFQPAPLLDTFGQIEYGHPPTEDMSDWKPTPVSVIPFMSTFMWNRISECFPKLERLMYYSDDLISRELARFGFLTTCRKHYRFKHYVEQVMRGGPGMNQQERMEHDYRIFVS